MPLFKTPRFWYPDERDHQSLWASLLSPLSFLYALGHRWKMTISNPFRASTPVFCVGNIVAGGSGKTPVSLALMELIQKYELAHAPYFLTRGYGGSITNTTLVNTVKHDAGHVGDESILLAGKAPVVKSAQRDKGAIFAQDNGADFILMDDGFQNQSLHKDVSFLVIDGQSGLGNEKLLPAGPLREPLAKALERTSAVIFLGDDRHAIKNRLPSTLPVFQAQISTDHQPETDRNYIAFCGLARPEKFFNTLDDLNLKVLQCHAYPDHHQYTQDELNELIGFARHENATLITTEKDMVKLTALSGSEEIEALPISLMWEDESAVLSFLKGALS